MYKKDKTNDPNVDRRKAGDQKDMHRTGDGTTDMREANENIRKSQGEDAGPRPTIDRHR